MVVGRFFAFHRGNFWVVETLRTFPPGDNDVALVEFQPNQTGDVALRFGDKRLERFTLRRKPKAVVNQFAVFWNQTVAQVHHFAVHGQRFHLAMREMQDRAARRFVNAAAFHSNESILDDVDPADPVFAAEFVQRLHDAERRKFFAVHFHTISGFECKIDMFRFIRRVFRRDAELVHAAHFL